MESLDSSEKIMRFRAAGKAEKILYAVGPPAAGAAIWETLAKAMDASADLRAIRLPGRESRFLEDPLRSTDLQVRDLLPEIQAEIEDEHLPYSVVGMCSGAVLAFELAAALEEARDLRGPDSLIVIHQAPPADPLPRRAAPGEPDDEVSHQEWLADAGLPAEMITAEVLEIFGPTIDADLAALSAYEYRGKILAADIIVVRGEVQPWGDVDRWSAFTEGKCEFVRVAGKRPRLNAGLGPVVSAVLPAHGIAGHLEESPKADVAEDAIAEVRSEVRRIWVSVLPAAGLDETRGFFESGGSSVEMLRVLALLNERFPDVFKLIDLYENPSIESQAQHILSFSAAGDDGTRALLSGRERLAEKRRARRAAREEADSAVVKGADSGA